MIGLSRYLTKGKKTTTSLHSALSAVKSALKFNKKNLLFAIQGDSTGNNDNEWWILFLKEFIKKYPAYNLYRRLWDDTSKSYGEVVGLSQGSSGYKYAGITSTGANQVISTPDSASLDITGDIEITALVALDNWKPTATTCIVEKWTTAGQRSYMLLVNATSGTIDLYWSNDGTTVNNIASTTAPTVANGSLLYIKVTFDVNNGAGGCTAKFYQSSDGETWTQIGTDVTQAGTTSIFAGTNLVRLGSYAGGSTWHLEGKLYTCTIRNGIGGTPVLMFDAGMHYNGTTLQDLLGLTYTAVGAVSFTGGNSLQALNGCVSGQIASYATTNIATLIPSEPDLNFLNYCHNEGTNVDYTDYKTLLDALRTKYPRMGIVCSTQNQQNTTEVGYIQHGIRNSQVAKYAGVTNSVLIDFFTKTLDYAILDITSGDNVHPSANGHALWSALAQEIFKGV